MEPNSNYPVRVDSSPEGKVAPLTPVITTQPEAEHGPVQMPSSIPVHVPQGLEPLVNLDTLLIKQQIELLEVLCGCETNNRYRIRDTQGRQIFAATEDTECCTRNMCGAARPFEIEIKDARGQQVIRISRPFACGCWWCNCCLHEITVMVAPGQLAGTVEQLGGYCGCTPKFAVRNGQGTIELMVEGQECSYCVHCCTVTFNVLSADTGRKVGEIKKQWSGLGREFFTDADNFGISFPADLDVKMKAVLLGALFLIDFMFFEQKQNGWAM